MNKRDEPAQTGRVEMRKVKRGKRNTRTTYKFSGKKPSPREISVQVELSFFSRRARYSLRRRFMGLESLESRRVRDADNKARCSASLIKEGINLRSGCWLKLRVYCIAGCVSCPPARRSRHISMVDMVVEEIYTRSPWEARRRPVNASEPARVATGLAVVHDDQVPSRSMLVHVRALS
jgi:hypothetical protein